MPRLRLPRPARSRRKGPRTGRRPPLPRPARFAPPPWERARRRRRRARVSGTLILALVLLGLWLWLPQDGWRAEPEPDPLGTGIRRVEARFSPCGPGRLPHCVVDGDTIKLGAVTVRLHGYDAPELRGQCQRESELAARATQALLAWVNAGPFVLRPPPGRTVDKYGRPLREAFRDGQAGYSSAAGQLIGRGLARSYGGDARRPWCPDLPEPPAP